jgi:hypothetical protein
MRSDYVTSGSVACHDRVINVAISREPLREVEHAEHTRRRSRSGVRSSRSFSNSSTSQGEPRYQRTATMIIPDGKRNPAKPDCTGILDQSDDASLHPGRACHSVNASDPASLVSPGPPGGAVRRFS